MGTPNRIALPGNGFQMPQGQPGGFPMQVPPELAAALQAQQRVAPEIQLARDVNSLIAKIDRHLKDARDLEKRIDGVFGPADQVAALRKYLERLEKLRTDLVPVQLAALAPTMDGVASDFEGELAAIKGRVS